MMKVRNEAELKTCHDIRHLAGCATCSGIGYWPGGWCDAAELLPWRSARLTNTSNGEQS